MKKVCLIIPSLEAGGMERVMSILAINFYKIEKIIPVIIMYGKNPEVFYALPVGMQVFKPEFQFNNQFRLWHTIKTILYIRKQVKILNPDSILSFGERWNNLVLLSLIGLSIPKFVSDRSQPGKQLGIFHETMRKYLYPKASGIIAQTNYSKITLQEKLLNKNIKVIPNPITPFSTKVNFERKNVILTVGRLIPSKNHDKLINSFSRIIKNKWQLVIVGHDNNNLNISQKLQQQIHKLNMSMNVVLLGKQLDLEKYYFTSKIFAFMSTSEGYPNAIAEALSAGLPVVAFDCIAGPSEMIVDGYNGFLIPLNDYDLFENKLSLLMNDEILREKMSQNAVRSSEKFNAELISKKFLQFIISLAYLILNF